MRDHVLFYVNGKRFEVRGESAFASLTDFLRQELLLTGTKVVCAEGDCGACTVLVGRPEGSGLRYETVDACIQFLYQIDGTHVVTVEGLPGPGPAQLHPVQRAMVEHHGSQCGFCTPGFVMALAGMFEEGTPADRHDLQTALTGNLCRCTGYLPILEAAAALDPAELPSLAAHYASTGLAADLRAQADTPVLIRQGGRTFFSPRSLADALAFKAQHPDALIVSGGTELGVLRNKQGLDPPTLMSLAHVPGLAEITTAGPNVTVGANVTWRRIEAFAKEALPEFYGIVVRFGSPQIRNVATLIANVAHGSPIADSLPLLCVMDAELELVSVRGSRRVKVNGFYQGYKVKDLARDEIITHLSLPLPAPDELLKLYKVSRRNDLDIATFGAGVRVRRAGEIITRAYIAYTGVGPTVLRLPVTETFLQGKRFAEEMFREAGRLARTEVQPITDVRGSRDFRLLLAENILAKFYFDCASESLPGAV
jgi:xanthine dehydrogenase small subunit